MRHILKTSYGKETVASAFCFVLGSTNRELKLCSHAVSLQDIFLAVVAVSLLWIFFLSAWTVACHTPIPILRRLNASTHFFLSSCIVLVHYYWLHCPVFCSSSKCLSYTRRMAQNNTVKIQLLGDTSAWIKVQMITSAEVRISYRFYYLYFKFLSFMLISNSCCGGLSHGKFLLWPWQCFETGNCIF